MRIVLDCDGVLSDFVGAALPVAQKFMPELTREKITQFGIEEMLPKNKRESYLRLVVERIWYPGLCSDMTVFPGARDFVDLLRAEEVIIATAPYRDLDGSIVGPWVSQRERWIQNHIGSVPVVFTDQKELLHGNVLVDDKWENCRYWALTGRTALLFDRPWNRQTKDSEPRIIRVRGYDEVLEYLKEKT